MVKEMKIVLHPYPTEGFYLAGSSVTGEVFIKTGSKKTNYSRVDLTLTASIQSNFSDQENGIRCAHSDELVKNTITIWDKAEEGGKFPKGVSQLPFAMMIPASDTTFPTLDVTHSTVTYYVHANIVKEGRSKDGSSTNTTIKVLPPVNVGGPELQEPENARVEIPIPSLCCFSGGSIETEIRLPHKSYEVGEVLEFEVEVVNDTRKRLPYFDGGLMQKVTYGGTPTSRFRNSSAILYGEETNLIGERAKSNLIIPRSNWGESLVIRIPATLPPTYNSVDSMLSIEYFVLVRVHRSNNARDSITLECPVVIGNIRSQLGLEPSASFNPGPPPDLSGYGDQPPAYFDILNTGGVTMETTTSPTPSAPTLSRDSEL